MKKQLKWMIVPCATAAIMIGGATVSFAATGWQQDDGNWHYYYSDGERVTDSWKKSGSNWYYLDSDGEMAISSVIEDDDNYYYVNSVGAMVSNEWREVDNTDDDSDDAPDTCWYYFAANGKAYKASDSGKTSLKTITNASGQAKKYIFDSEGKMLFGWVNDESERVTGEDAWRDGVYYCGDAADGALAINSWRELEAIDADNEDDDFQESYWFYFGANGKKIVDSTKTINGKKYRFDEFGAAEFKWYQKGTSSNATGSNASGSGAHIYYNDPSQCWQATGWFKAVPGPEVDQEGYDDGKEFWFYAQNNGELVVSQIKTIDGHQYGFNEMGEMLHGLYKIKMEHGKIVSYEEIESESDLPDETEDWLVYHFGHSPKEGVMKTGTEIIELDGEKYSYNFKKTGSSKGAGYEGIHDDAIHIKGRVLKADKDMKVQVVDYDGKSYLVNTSGKLQKNKKNVKDTDDNYYSTDKNGVVTYSGTEKQ